MTVQQSLNACGFELQRDAWARLILVDAEGRRHEGVEPVRAFPISDPRHCICLVDAAGQEVLAIEDLQQLPPHLRTLLEEELARREFVPVIQRILSVSADSDPSEWRVQTDRGPTQFCLDNENDLRRIGPHRALLVDGHGIRYLIPDLRALDPSSRRILSRYF